MLKNRNFRVRVGFFNEIDMIELNTAYNRVMMLIEKVTDLYAE
jgi:hypothetical protein